MRRLRKRTAVAIALAVAAAIAASLVVGVESLRSATFTAAVRIVLHDSGGFALRSGDLVVDRDDIEATGVDIVDSAGRAVFSAERIEARIDPARWLGRSDRGYGLVSLDIERPWLHLVRLADGSYNVSRLVKWPTSTTSSKLMPLRFALRVHQGVLDVADPSAPAPAGRHFKIDGIQVGGIVDQTYITTVSARGRYIGGIGTTPLAASLFENDRERFAQATLQADRIDAAPIVDGLVPTPAFALEQAVLRHATIKAFALDYNASVGPQWYWSGSGYIAYGRFRVRPVVLAVDNVAGPLEFAGGSLTTTGMRAMLGGAPIAIRGGMRLLGGVRLGFAVSGRQALSQLRHAFAFSSRVDVRGPLEVAIRIDGAPSSVDVAGSYRSSDTVRFQGLPLTNFSGTLFYNGEHITIPEAAANYSGASLLADGDVDITSGAPAARFDVVATMPSGDLPIAANVNPDGTARALVEIDGPVSALEGSGYGEIVAGNATTARMAVFAGPKRFALGPALIDEPGGGEIMLRAAVDRSATNRTIEGFLAARRYPMHLRAASRSLPGINDKFPIALPAIEGMVSGTLLVRGDETAPDVLVSAAADDLTIAGARLGHAIIAAVGTRGRVDIARLSIDGADATVRASGSAEMLPRSRAYAAVLSGDVRADLAAINVSAPGTRFTGTAAGTFDAALSGGRWTVALRGRSGDATFAGVKLRALDASLGGGGGGSTDVYAGSVGVAGGVVSGMGVIPPANKRGGDLGVWTDGLDLAALAPLGAPFQRGRATAIAHIGGSLAQPEISAATSIVGAGIGDQPLSGDVDATYSAGRLIARNGRVAVGGGVAEFDGMVSGLSSGDFPGHAVIALNASMREGDLGALAGRYLPKQVLLAGTVAATLRVTGNAAAPKVDGDVDADSGTLQGVAFENLHGNVHVESGSVQVTNGSVGLASSHFDFLGSLSRSSLHLRASSAAVDLADFNDFFEGYDSLEGTGSGNIAFESTQTGVLASGGIHLMHAAVAGFPLGAVKAKFASRGDELLGSVSQNGDAGASDLNGSVTFGKRRTALPDLRTASYDVRGTLRGIDVGRVAPLFGKGAFGLTGVLDANGTLRGNLHAPTAHADFKLRSGHLGKIALEEASGSIDAGADTVAIRNAAIAMPFAHLSGEGSIGPGKRVAATIGIDASDLGALFALFGEPGVASGTALASAKITGTSASPRVDATIVSGRGSALGVNFDRLTGTVKYGPGELDIADAEVDLTGNRGVISIGGTLPLQLSPFGLGPKDRRIGLSMIAKAVDLSALDPLTRKYVTLTGTLDAQGNVSGSAGRPQLTGSARLRNASVSSRFETVPAEHVDADLVLSRDSLTLAHLGGQFGRGSIAGSGAVHIVPAAGLLNSAGLQFWTRLNLRGAQIDVPGWTSGSVNGTLRLTKSGTTPFLSGDVTLEEGNIPFSAIYALASGYGSGPAPTSGSIPGVPELRPGHIIVYGGGVFAGGGPFVISSAPGSTPTQVRQRLPDVDVSVAARAGRNVRVHGGAIDLTASGGVAIGGNLNAPTLAGTFTSTRGEIGYFDTNFRLVRGTVTFDPIEGLLPTLDVKAVTNLSGTEITLTVTGRVDNLQTDLSANPSMSRDEIVATLLHAPQVQSVISSNPGQAQTQLYNEAENYFNAQLSRSLLFPVESLVAQTLNIEQISLIYDQQGSVDVEVRKLIAPSVFAIYRSSLNIPVTQTAGVAYSLRDYADLEILQTQSPTGLSQTVLNLRLTFH